MKNVAIFCAAFAVGLLPVGSASAGQDQEGCRVAINGRLVELRCPSQVLILDASARLQAVSWENRLSGTKLSLGNGPEVELEVGSLSKPEPVPLEVVHLPVADDGKPSCQATFKLASKAPPLSVVVTYRLDAAQPVMRKFVEVSNDGDREVVLLNVRLGNYTTDAVASRAEQGFPVYVGDAFFLTLAHPSGFADGGGKAVVLRHHPGARLAPGKTLQCMEAVLGVGRPGEARQTFVSHVRSRMRRVLRGHDKPYAIYEPFGGRPGGSFDETEEYLLDNIAKLAAGKREAGYQFDYYSVDFWHDVRGDLIRFDPQRFPSGFAKIKAALDQIGVRPGLWIDSGGLPQWTIGGNPAVRPSMTDPKGGGILCRAAEPIKSMYAKAFVHHIKENGVRLLKFDNLGPGSQFPVCNNPNHGHLPGIYSLEAIHNSVIEFLRVLDGACPDVVLMLYWGYRSPWWLLHADTYFDSGEHIEAASPTAFPAPYARDSVTQRLDQAQWVWKDVPALGRDSLGIWLSDWPWNSCIGKERWQEGFLMDICRGSLLAQVWTDSAWLSPPERGQIADFVALLKANPACFANPRSILGNPWNPEPYGYCCTDGARAFLAINNCCWQDSSIPLKLGPAWGLPAGRSWDIYRWYPDPARLKPSAGERFGEEAAICLRPFQVVLLEVVQEGVGPSLAREFAETPIPTRFAEPTRAVELVEWAPQTRQPVEPARSIWSILQPSSATSAGGATLTAQKDHSILASGKVASPDTYTITARTELPGITAIQLEALCGPGLPCDGPGRAVNGNFALMELSVAAAPTNAPGKPVPVTLRNPRADFSQTGYGGWPVSAAIDGDPKTGWSVDPEEGAPHVAIFETGEPVGFEGGTVLTFRFAQGDREHSIGRLRLSVTAAKPPLTLPAGNGGTLFRCELPPCSRGGILVLIGRKGAREPKAKLAGQPVAAAQVWHDRAMYPATWQAWRLEVPPSPTAMPLELTMPRRNLPGRAASSAYLIPR